MMSVKSMKLGAIAFSLSISSMCVCAQSPANESKTQAFHKSMVVMDTHLDTPALLVQPGFDIMHAHTVDGDFSQVDVPRMDAGGLDGGFWVIYTSQGPVTDEGFKSARDTALLRTMAIHKMVEANPDTFALATNPGDAKAVWTCVAGGDAPGSRHGRCFPGHGPLTGSWCGTMVNTKHVPFDTR